LPATQWVPDGQYVDEQFPLQSLAAQLDGEKDSEQQCDQQALDAMHPRQK
jgi:hypothetical protein